MGWRTIYIEENNNLSLYLDNLKVTKENEESFLIPLKDIDTIVIDNYKLNLTASLIYKCNECNINFIICNHSHLPVSQMLPLSGNCLSSKIFFKQLKWDEDKKGNLWKEIVKHKIHNQNYVLRQNQKDNYYINMLEEFENDVEYYDKSNREGLAAKAYFRALFGEKFKRFSEDCINAGLNYGYIVLRAMIAKSLVSKGLNCMLGIFHKGESNDFNLADDLLEVFRPIIDMFVYKNLIEEQVLTREHRISIIKLLTNKIEIDNKKQTISNAIDIYVESIINYFENGTEVLFPLVQVYDV